LATSYQPCAGTRLTLPARPPDDRLDAMLTVITRGVPNPARPGRGVSGVVGHDHFRCRTTPSHTWNGRTALVGIVTVVVTGPVAPQLGKTLGVGHAGVIAWETVTHQ
jgi:hypothetical protein